MPNRLSSSAESHSLDDLPSRLKSSPAARASFPTSRTRLRSAAETPSCTGQKTIREHFDWVTEHDREVRPKQREFHLQLLQHFRHHIPKGSRVLEWGCSYGDLLRCLEPSRGLGIDFSEAMVRKARTSAGDSTCEFRVGDVLGSEVAEGFDHIICDYLLGYVPDIQAALEKIKRSTHPHTRLHITALNTSWKHALPVAEKLGWAMPQPASNWLSLQDITNLLELTGWEVVSRQTIQLLPFNVAWLGNLCNRVLVRLPFLRHFGATMAVTARPRIPPRLDGEITCSVVVPVIYETGDIRAALERIPRLGRRTEIIFVDCGSTEGTWAAIEKEAVAHVGPHLVRAVRHSGSEKREAICAGFAVARGDVLAILDSSSAMPADDLARSFDLIESGRADVVIGDSLVYPIPSESKRIWDIIKDHFFAIAFGYVLGQPVKDSLCGTKMLLRSDYERLLERIKPFGDFDPFGDFNLLYGSALLDLRIRDIPVRYKDRTYGETNISRFSHGKMLLKMVWFGLKNLKWV